MKKRIIVFLFLFLSFNLSAFYIEDPNNFSDFVVILKKLHKEGKLKDPQNMIGIYKYAVKQVKGLGTSDGFVALSLIIVPLCGLVSLFVPKEQIDVILENGSDNISNKIYKISQCVGQCQGAYEYGNQSGKKKMKYKFLCEPV